MGVGRIWKNIKKASLKSLIFFFAHCKSEGQKKNQHSLCGCRIIRSFNVWCLHRLDCVEIISIQWHLFVFWISRAEGWIWSVSYWITSNYSERGLQERTCVPCAWMLVTFSECWTLVLFYAACLTENFCLISPYFAICSFWIIAWYKAAPPFANKVSDRANSKANLQDSVKH